MSKVEIQRAHRMDGTGEYYFSRRLREIAEIEATTGRQIIKLAMGSPDLPPHPSVIERLHQEALRPDVHKYMSFKGEPVLRKAFADWYAKWYGVELNYNTEVLPLIGSKEGIMHICQTFINPGDKVLVPNPGYPTYTSAVTLAGGVATPYDLNEDNGYLPELENIDPSGVKMMIINYPQMPTGTVASLEELQRIVDFCRKNSILLLNDNPYCFIRNAQPVSLMQVEGAKEVAMELNSLSKSHNMAGWRIGMLAASEQRITEVLRFKSNMDSGMFLPLQLAAATALSLGSEWYEKQNSLYYRREKIGEQIFDALGIEYSQNQAGLFLWGRLPEGIDCYEFCDKLLYEKGVFLTPGAVFGSNGTRYMRLSLCATEEVLLSVLNIVKQ